MPSKKKQVNVRLSPETVDKLNSLADRMRSSLNVDVSQADAITAALAELEKRYPAEPRPRKKKSL